MLDDGIAEIRDQLTPSIAAVDGFVGMSMLVDRESGRCIITSAWDSEQALVGSRQAVRPLRDQAVECLGGDDPQVEEWEIALLHRDHPVGGSACARVTWLQGSPEDVDDNVDLFRSQVLPRLEEIPGFCSVSVLVDHATGRASTAVTYETREALEQSRQAAREIREQVMPSLKGQFQDIAEFEVALAHLRVPETV